MNTAAVVMFIIAVVLLVVAYVVGDNLHILGLKTAAKMFVQIIPILVAAFIIAGMVQVLIPREFIIKMAGATNRVEGDCIRVIGWRLDPRRANYQLPHCSFHLQIRCRNWNSSSICNRLVLGVSGAIAL